jgi:hypothetical protein
MSLFERCGDYRFSCADGRHDLADDDRPSPTVFGSAKRRGFETTLGARRHFRPYSGSQNTVDKRDVELLKVEQQSLAFRIGKTFGGR